MEFNFKNIKKVYKELYCPKCKKIFSKPMRLLCGCSYCYNCCFIDNEFTCYQHFIKQKKEYIKMDYIISKIIDDLLLYCCNKEKGCDWEGRFELYKNHLSICKFK